MDITLSKEAAEAVVVALQALVDEAKATEKSAADAQMAKAAAEKAAADAKAKVAAQAKTLAEKVAKTTYEGKPLLSDTTATGVAKLAAELETTEGWGDKLAKALDLIAKVKTASPAPKFTAAQEAQLTPAQSKLAEASAKFDKSLGL